MVIIIHRYYIYIYIYSCNSYYSVPSLALPPKNKKKYCHTRRIWYYTFNVVYYSIPYFRSPTRAAVFGLVWFGCIFFIFFFFEMPKRIALINVVDERVILIEISYFYCLRRVFMRRRCRYACEVYVFCFVLYFFFPLSDWQS